MPKLCRSRQVIPQVLRHSLSLMSVSRPTTVEKPPFVRNGDFAEFIQGGVTAPGEVPRKKQASPAGEQANDALQQIQHSPSRSVAGWIVSFATMGFLGSVSYLALKERVVTLGGRNGLSLFEGHAAVVVGFLLLAGALLPIVQLTRHTRFAKLVVLHVAWVWVASIILYLGANMR